MYSEYLPLNADDLLQLGDDLDEIVLGSHDFLDVFVGTGDLVYYTLVLSAFDAGGLLFQVFDRVLRLRFGSGHLSSCTVRARIERLWVSEALDDERFRSHRTGDDPISALFGVYRTLSGYVNLVAEMLLDRDVVVMAVDRDLGTKLLLRVEHSVE